MTFTILKFIKVEMLNSFRSLPLCFTMADAYMYLLLTSFYSARILTQWGFGAKTKSTFPFLQQWKLFTCVLFTPVLCI